MEKCKYLTFRRVMRKCREITWSIPNNLSLRVAKPINDTLYAKALEFAKQIPNSNGSAYYEKLPLRVGVITDEFMFNYYKDSVELIYMAHDDALQMIKNGKIDVLMYISCWRGMQENDWRGEERQAEIPSLIQEAKWHGLTTIFQSIEDPTNYEHFLPIAKACDYVFTSDIDMVEEYKKDTENENCFHLGYGINPLFHNPIGSQRKREWEEEYDTQTVFFAGSWLDRYTQRARDIKLLLDGAIEANASIMIADRNSNLKVPGYRYPVKYRKYIEPAMEHSTLQKVHKLFDFNMNINTVQDSATMCAMRVYELQALRSLVLSNYSLATAENFPGIFTVNHPSEAKEILRGYGTCQKEQMATENLRNVMTNLTVYDRWNEIFYRCRMPFFFEQKTVVVACDKMTQAVKKEFNKQTYENKVLINKRDLAKQTADFVAYFEEGTTYPSTYLTDMLNAFKYVDVDFVTAESKEDSLCYEFVSSATSKYKTVFKKDFDVSHSLEGNGFLIDALLREQEETTQKELAVIIPVFNNGKYLLGRCLHSLMRSSIYSKMQLYIIDDGSSDKETLAILDDLETKENVTLFRFMDGGSGSASRPRNKGVEMAKEPYLTFLDPDNEAIHDGYAKLLCAIREQNVSFSFGAIYKKIDSSNMKRLGYFFGDQKIENPKETLLQEKFRVQSIQACVINTSFLESIQIDSPEGAVGQDSLFFDELMLNAENAYYVNEPIHLYYAQRANSETNVTGAGFFKKSLLLEIEQVKRFEKYGVLDSYKKDKLDYFVLNWYVPKLQKVAEEELHESKEILNDILKMYDKRLEEYGEII